ncbi:marine proteobacterial sortase target protein [Thiorhodovibrio winogradskyi]|uniref:Marine proteobacterial sortase target protein n=1 Tax=Thiorhodovibrio winogradskyi TaxID=77007 RepID=A0ABZ0S4X8_9GAMM|nr:VWA domain-containing protein [Thiorhodovibrio winogradskyi]
MFHLATDRSLIRASGHSRRFLHVFLEAPRADGAQNRPPLDLALVLDRSGSMGGHKWPRACDAASQAARRLSGEDRLALVVYDDRIDRLLDLTPAGGRLATQVEQVLSGVDPRGTTNLSGGWLTGCGLVGETTDDQRLHRCFLLTDGLANQGLTNPAELAEHAAALYARGVITSTFGVGDDYDEALLGTLADAGGGHLYDIERAEQIEVVLARELGDALDVVWRDAWLILKANGGVRIEPLGVFRGQATNDGFRVRLGDLVSEQVQDVLLAVTFPDGTEQTECQVEVALEVDGQTLATGKQTWTWANHQDNNRQPRERSVDRLVAAYYANLARREAAVENRRGEVDQARHRVRAVARRINSYAGEDVELQELAATLDREAEEYHHRFSSRDAKTRYFSSASQMKGRAATGERRRRDREKV